MTPYFLAGGLDIPVPAMASPGDGGASEIPLTVSGEGGADVSARLRRLEGVSGTVPGSCFTTMVLVARVGVARVGVARVGVARVGVARVGVARVAPRVGRFELEESGSLPFSVFAAGRFAGMFLGNPDG